LPLAALGLLVGLTLWLDQLVQPAVARADGSKRHDPDVMVENFNARKLNIDGAVQYTLTARKMVHYPDDDSALLESLTLEAFEPKQPKMTITARNGRLEQGGDRVFIEGDVVVVREADAKNAATRLTTDKRPGAARRGIARGSSPVTRGKRLQPRRRRVLRAQQPHPHAEHGKGARTFKPAAPMTPSSCRLAVALAACPRPRSAPTARRRS
jgi:lipopolysaccharide export system protein LptC